MSSTIERRLDRADSETITSNPTLISQAGLRRKTISLAPLAVMLVVVLGLASLIAFSIANDKLFFGELLLCAFIIIALMFFKASAAPRK